MGQIPRSTERILVYDNNLEVDQHNNFQICRDRILSIHRISKVTDSIGFRF